MKFIIILLTTTLVSGKFGPTLRYSQFGGGVPVVGGGFPVFGGGFHPSSWRTSYDYSRDGQLGGQPRQNRQQVFNDYAAYKPGRMPRYDTPGGGLSQGGGGRFGPMNRVIAQQKRGTTGGEFQQRPAKGYNMQYSTGNNYRNNYNYRTFTSQNKRSRMGYGSLDNGIPQIDTEMREQEYSNVLEKQVNPQPDKQVKLTCVICKVPPNSPPLKDHQAVDIVVPRDGGIPDTEGEGSFQPGISQAHETDADCSGPPEEPPGSVNNDESVEPGEQ